MDNGEMTRHKGGVFVCLVGLTLHCATAATWKLGPLVQVATEPCGSFEVRMHGCQSPSLDNRKICSSVLSSP